MSACPPEGRSEYPIARELMSTMVEHSQRSGEGNMAFIQAMEEVLAKHALASYRQADPCYNNRANLVVHIGDEGGEEALVAVSHSDVVGVDGQHWSTKPWKLHEENELWIGRGTCDTHGTGVGMLLAGMRPAVQERLKEARKRISIIFTYDEEATSPEFSMRGARLAAGLLGKPAIISADTYLVGEPTEIDGHITPMRAHKGRFLAHFVVHAPQSGHVSQIVQNALMGGARIIHEISEYGRMLHYGSKRDVEAMIFDPPHSTVQVSAGDVKKGEYSTTPEHARFTVDMRTLPFVHRLRVEEMIDLITSQILPHDEAVSLEIAKDGEGSVTPAESDIVRIAEEVTGRKARGFNGGDEGRIFRNSAGMQGVTLGPGDLAFAHQPDERIRIASVLRSVDTYGAMFLRSADTPSPCPS